MISRSVVLSLMMIAMFQSSDAQSKKKVSISKSGRYFIDENAKPLFWQGDTEWELFHMFTAKQAQAFMLERKKQGFNVIQVMSTGVYPEWGASKGADFTGAQQAWTGGNPATPNRKYFSRVDSIVTAAEKNNMLLVIGVFHAVDIEKNRITLQNIKGWSTWLASRYRNASNVIWSMYPHGDSTSIAFVREAVAGIQAGDGGSHLITVHPDPAPKSSSFMHGASWLSFNTLQTWRSDYVNYEMVKKDYEKNPPKPVVNGEARYENEDGTTALQTRMGGYWSYLAGGYYTYGHESNWKSPGTWKQWLNTEGATGMRVLGEFFRSISWWKLSPDQSLLVNPLKGDVAAFSSDGDLAVVYITNAQPFSLQFAKFKGKNITGNWVDPLTGTKTTAGSFDRNKVFALALPRGWKDGILLIKSGD